MMYKVYASAEEVLIWLGETDPQIEETSDSTTDTIAPSYLHEELDDGGDFFVPIFQDGACSWTSCGAIKSVLCKKSSGPSKDYYLAVGSTLIT
jgi:hypothetical protein